MFIIKLGKSFRNAKDNLMIYLRKKTFGLCEEGVQIFPNSTFMYPNNIYLHKYSRIMPQCIIMASGGKFIFKKFCGASLRLTVVTSNHCPSVGIPNTLNNTLHINEVIKGDVVVDEDSWLGINVTLLPGAHIGRGSVVGANSLVNKEFPPYAVIVGTPAKIIGAKFTKEQILKHEELIYPKHERFTKEYLDDLFNKYYSDKKTIGTEYISAEDRERYNAYLKEKHVIL